MTSQELDEIRAAGEGMYDRREDEHHPVNTDPPKPTGPQEPTTRAEAQTLPKAGAPDGPLVCARLASQDETDSGIEEDARHGDRFNVLTVQEEGYMALARSCSDETMRLHLADFGITHPEPAALRRLAGRCYILARRLEMGNVS